MKPRELQQVIANNIRVKRKLLHMTQGKLGELYGNVSSARISQIESGEENLSTSAIATLAELLETEPSVLMTPNAFEKSKRIYSASA